MEVGVSYVSWRLYFRYVVLCGRISNIWTFSWLLSVKINFVLNLNQKKISCIILFFILPFRWGFFKLSRSISTTSFFLFQCFCVFFWFKIDFQNWFQFQKFQRPVSNWFLDVTCFKWFEEQKWIQWNVNISESTKKRRINRTDPKICCGLAGVPFFHLGREGMGL